MGEFNPFYQKNAKKYCDVSDREGSVWIFHVVFFFLLEVTVLLALPMQEGDSKNSSRSVFRINCSLAIPVKRQRQSDVISMLHWYCQNETEKVIKSQIKRVNNLPSIISLQAMLENLQVLLEINIVLLVGKYELLDNIWGRKTF